MKVVEMFTGLGSQAKALHEISEKRDLSFEIVKTCEWNIHAIVAYHLIHNKTTIDSNILKLSKEEVLKELSTFNLSLDGKDPINPKYLKTLNVEILKEILNSIKANNNLIDIKKVTYKDIPEDTDLLTYSFPCQDLSNVSFFHGNKGGIDKDKNTRSGLLWEVERILEEKKLNKQKLPKFLLLENVTALEASRNRGNFQLWQTKLEELGYINKVYKLNAENFGVPQYRNRLIMLSVFVGKNKNLKKKLEAFWEKNNLNNIDYVSKLGIIPKELGNLLRTNYKKKNLLEEAKACQPNATSSRLKIWQKNSIILDHNNNFNKRVQTITTKQDRHPNSGNLYFNPKNDKSRYRFLTPRECFLLMGFDEKDYEELLKNNKKTRADSLFFSRDILYKLAGNSIVVDVLKAVFNQLLDIKETFKI